MTKIGIIGFGFVGRAVFNGFKTLAEDCEQEVQFLIYDPYVKDAPFPCGLDTVGAESDFIFVCVPTPTNFEQGKQDLSIINNVLQNLKTNAVIIIKSTVVPGTTVYLSNNHKLNLVFNPEFLVERTANEDFLNQNRIVLGGRIDLCQAVKNLYQTFWPDAVYYFMSSTEAELVKYAANSYLATKVAYFNDIFEICQRMNLDWQVVRAAVTADERIGKSHSDVPGFDGRKGFGGKCFPKDIVVLIGLLKHLGIENSVAETVWHRNLVVRPEEDWRQIKGVVGEK